MEHLLTGKGSESSGRSGPGLLTFSVVARLTLRAWCLARATVFRIGFKVNTPTTTAYKSCWTYVATSAAIFAITLELKASSVAASFACLTRFATSAAVIGILFEVFAHSSAAVAVIVTDIATCTTVCFVCIHVDACALAAGLSRFALDSAPTAVVLINEDVRARTTAAAFSIFA